MFGTKITTAFAVAALSAVSALPGAAAHSRHKDFRIEMVPVHKFYGDFENGYALFAGLSPEDYCNDVAPPMAEAKVFERGDGTLKVKVHHANDVDLFLYEFDGPPPALIGATCDAMFDDDPATEPLQPLAIGSGRVRIIDSGLETLDAPGGYHASNSTKGKVTAADGRRWKVRGLANLDLEDDGFPIGDPVDFQSLKLRELRY